MAEALKPRTSDVNGKLWGAAAEDWAAIQEPLLRAVFVQALDRLRVGPGTRYLDVGCGAGLAVRIAGERGALCSGLDAADGMLAVARRRSPRADLRRGDLEELPFADQSFDVVTGFNSFQFAGNPSVALTEARRVARPDGRILIMTWGKPEGMEAASIITSLRALLPPPPPGAPGPFALSDEATLRGFAAAAGLKPLEIVDVPCDFVYPDLATGLRGMNATGVARVAIERSGEKAVSEAHAAALAPFRQKDGSYRAKGGFRYLVAAP